MQKMHRYYVAFSWLVKGNVVQIMIEGKESIDCIVVYLSNRVTFSRFFLILEKITYACMCAQKLVKLNNLYVKRLELL